MQKRTLQQWLIMLSCMFTTITLPGPLAAQKSTSTPLLFVAPSSAPNATPLQTTKAFFQALRRHHNRPITLFQQETRRRSRPILSRKKKLQHQLQRLIQSAQEQFYAQHFSQSLQSLQRAKKHLYSAAPRIWLPSLVIRRALLCGRVYLAQQKKKEARALFAEALRQDPRLKLSSRLYPPAMIAAFQKTRQEFFQSWGKLTVSTTPPGARLFLNGRDVGETNLRLAQLLSGRYAVKLTRSGHLPWYGWVHLKANHTAKLNIRLLPLRPPATLTPNLSSSSTRSFLSAWLSFFPKIILAGPTTSASTTHLVAALFQGEPNTPQRKVSLPLSRLSPPKKQQVLDLAARYLLTGQLQHLAALNRLIPSGSSPPPRLRIRRRVPPPPSHWRSPALSWSFVGLGALAVGGGVGLFFWASEDRRNAQTYKKNPEDQDIMLALLHSANAKETGAIISWIGGGLLFLSGVSLLLYQWLSPSTPASQPDKSPSPKESLNLQPQGAPRNTTL